MTTDTEPFIVLGVHLYAVINDLLVFLAVAITIYAWYQLGSFINRRLNRWMDRWYERRMIRRQQERDKWY